MAGLNRYQRKIIKTMVENGESGPTVRRKIDHFINGRGYQRNKHLPGGDTKLNEIFAEWLIEQEYYKTAEYLMERVYK